MYSEGAFFSGINVLLHLLRGESFQVQERPFQICIWTLQNENSERKMTCLIWKWKVDLLHNILRYFGVRTVSRFSLCVCVRIALVNCHTQYLIHLFCHDMATTRPLYNRSQAFFAIHKLIGYTIRRMSMRRYETTVIMLAIECTELVILAGWWWWRNPVWWTGTCRKWRRTWRRAWCLRAKRQAGTRPLSSPSSISEACSSSQPEVRWWKKTLYHRS